jgi:hypothetical protein
LLFADMLSQHSRHAIGGSARLSAAHHRRGNIRKIKMPNRLPVLKASAMLVVYSTTSRHSLRDPGKIKIGTPSLMPVAASMKLTQMIAVRRPTIIAPETSAPHH